MKQRLERRLRRLEGVQNNRGPHKPDKIIYGWFSSVVPPGYVGERHRVILSRSGSETCEWQHVEERPGPFPGYS